MKEGQDWVYTDTVKEHFLNPRNFLMGDESKFACDATGLVGNPICGDQMKMFIKVKDDKSPIANYKDGCDLGYCILPIYNKKGCDNKFENIIKDLSCVCNW